MPATLCAPRLSSTTMSPGCNSGTSACRTHARKAGHSSDHRAPRVQSSLWRARRKQRWSFFNARKVLAQYSADQWASAPGWVSCWCWPRSHRETPVGQARRQAARLAKPHAPALRLDAFARPHGVTFFQAQAEPGERLPHGGDSDLDAVLGVKPLA